MDGASRQADGAGVTPNGPGEGSVVQVGPWMAQVGRPMVQVGAQMAQVRKKCAHLRQESGIHAIQWRRSATKNLTCAKTLPTCAIRALTCATVRPVRGRGRLPSGQGVENPDTDGSDGRRSRVKPGMRGSGPGAEGG